MTKKELIEAMAKKANITPDAADKALKALTTVITEALMQDDVITIPGLGFTASSSVRRGRATTRAGVRKSKSPRRSFRCSGRRRR